MTKPVSAFRRWRPWALSLAITGSLFAYLLSQIDPSQIITTARGMTPSFLLVFLTLLLTGVMARALRFWVLLARSTPLRLLSGIVMARNLFVDLLPARLGELSYVYLLTKRTGRPVEDGFASLMLAVAFDVVALSPLLLLAVLVVGGGEALAGPGFAVAAIGLGTLAYAGARLAGPVGLRVAVWLGTEDPTRWRGRATALIRKTAVALEDAWTRRIGLPVLAISVVVRLAKFGSYYFLVLAIMDPLGYSVSELGFFPVFLGVVSAELAAALPIHGIAGFGTFEAAWAISFTQLGFSREDAIISGILVHAVSQVVEYSLGTCALLYLMRPTAETTRHDAKP